MNLSTYIYTWFYGNFVGKDNFNNKYYCNSKDFTNLKFKRWVIFNGEVEASKIPPHWHAWLHKSISDPPLNYKHQYNWQKDFEQNFTGTDSAYYPDSHPLSKNKNDQNNESEYESWTP